MEKLNIQIATRLAYVDLHSRLLKAKIKITNTHLSLIGLGLKQP